MAGWQEQMIPTASGVEIETRFNGNITICNRLALIAHPWGRLGGSLNDHVVQSLASCLIDKHGYSVVLMNSRGVGRSKGSASFTCV
jgi:alpha/beta superfamily hydrolase